MGGVEIRPGTPVMLLNGAANRDPRRFECPAEFRLDRATPWSTSRSGAAPRLPRRAAGAREGRISLARILDRMRDIRLSEDHHGPPTSRRFEYEPTWVLRGLRRIHIEFTPVDGPTSG